MCIDHQEGEENHSGQLQRHPQAVGGKNGGQRLRPGHCQSIGKKGGNQEQPEKGAGEARCESGRRKAESGSLPGRAIAKTGQKAGVCRSLPAPLRFPASHFRLPISGFRISPSKARNVAVFQQLKEQPQHSEGKPAVELEVKVKLHSQVVDDFLLVPKDHNGDHGP